MSNTQSQVQYAQKKKKKINQDEYQKQINKTKTKNPTKGRYIIFKLQKIKGKEKNPERNQRGKNTSPIEEQRK